MGCLPQRRFPCFGVPATKKVTLFWGDRSKKAPLFWGDRPKKVLVLCTSAFYNTNLRVGCVKLSVLFTDDSCVIAQHHLVVEKLNINS